MKSFSGVDLSNPDPLGLGMQQRARDRRQGMVNRGELSIGDGFVGTSMGSQWDGFLEAMNGTRAGEMAPVNSLRSVQNPGQESNQMGGAGMAGSILKGIDDATLRAEFGGQAATGASRGLNTQMPISSRMSRGYQDHGQWMASQTVKKGKGGR
jgi:hypothetical protein